MSIFRCAQCDNPRDSDAEDHCEEAANGIDVICGACVDARDDEAAMLGQRHRAARSQHQIPPIKMDLTNDQ